MMATSAKRSKKRGNRRRAKSGFGQAVLESLRGWARGEPVTVRHVAEIPAPRSWRGADVRRLRTETLAVSQTVFARLLGVSPKLVEAWEAGRNVPAGPVRRLFELVERDPKEFLRRYFRGAA
jgi:putative transcriptional regulator